ncbi:MAG: SH3 domain-containing protein [Alphaproteobacteria bacterium]|nr:SH3 domain-containing protein [Alphaproteobacteria bacterium]
MRLLFLIFYSFFLVLTSGNTIAAENDAYRTSGYPVPRFVSISSDEVNVRTGPGSQYPIKWIITKKSLPVEVILEFDNWRKIKNFEGQEGWVFHTLLSGKRTGIIANDQEIFALKNPEGDPAKPLAKSVSMRLQPNALVKIDKCRDSWCKIDVQGYTGWITRKYLWGVYETEKID